MNYPYEIKLSVDIEADSDERASAISDMIADHIEFELALFYNVKLLTIHTTFKGDEE